MKELLVIGPLVFFLFCAVMLKYERARIVKKKSRGEGGRFDGYIDHYIVFGNMDVGFRMESLLALALLAILLYFTLTSP
jgi:hypothetical protein